MTGKAIARATGKPLYAVNHLEGHALTARLTDGLSFPYLMLLVSGGHTQLILVKGVGEYERWGTTIDDALGEAFDKTAKLLGLSLSGRAGRRAGGAGRQCGSASIFPGRSSVTPGSIFFFGPQDRRPPGRTVAGAGDDQDIADVCASFQRAISRTLRDRVGRA